MRIRTLILSAAALLVMVPMARAQVAVCGNGVTEAPELCDDGNVVDGDGCDSNCTPTSCGNGIVTPPETCDDGNLVDGDCCSATCLLEPNLPPDCSGAEPSVDELWPPNHKLTPVGITGVTDPDGDPIIVTVTAIAQDEPLDATGDGATCPDGLGVGLDTTILRSERSGHGDGRAYHVAFQAVDRCNAACSGEVIVCVRHDRSPKKSCGDGGPLYDSTAGAPPCEGDSCGPEDCVPDPEDVDSCDSETMPASVTTRLTRASSILADGKKAGKAVKQLKKAAKRVAKAGRRGDLSAPCSAAMSDALDGARTCVVCSGD
jgi:cysteine-rich repeat protein